ncbi:MAG: 1,4-alpha-glucan branching enzyme, partial [Spirochaetia bacterium]|nr:1,4-alpha-glucan branching enzyme [Spirochaetia bacterium]
MSVNSENIFLDDQDVYLFNEGTHYRIYDFLGAHVWEHNGQKGIRFAVWAPNAARVSVMGGFNSWDTESCPLYKNGDSGIWTGFVAGLCPEEFYKYHIVSNYNSYAIDKADPAAFYAQRPPDTASI